MKNQAILILIMMALIATSCKETSKEGDWDDNILLSTKQAAFKATGDSILISTGGNWWWISDIAINGTNYFNFSTVNMEQESYTITHDGLILQRRNKNTLFIKVDANPSATNRIITVGLQAGDYFDHVVITQKASPPPS